MNKFKRIYIEISNVCNFKCSFCPKSKRANKIMTLEEVKIVLKKISPYAEYIYLHVKGEPLLHPNLKEILDEAYKYNLQVNITTNGSLLEKQKEMLVQAKALRQINVSVHSIEQNSSNNITKEQYVDSVLEACKYIEENSKCIIAYRLWNLDSMSNVDKDLLLINKISKQYNRKDLLSEIKSNYAIKLKEKVFLNLDTIFAWPALDIPEINKYGTCYGLRQQLGILADGTVVPCCLDNDGDINLGNIFKQDLDEILESKRAKDIVEGFKTCKLVEPLCRRCGFRETKRR
ncbi:MAG: radical SAM protein [Clostridia bacterium]